MFSVVGSFSNAIGRAPNWRLVARLWADSSVKLPLICASPFGMTPSMVGAEITWPSRTTANCFWVPTRRREISSKTSSPSPPIVRLTTQLAAFSGMPADADSRSVPSIADAERRYLRL
jgi:hypothetical protein